MTAPRPAPLPPYTVRRSARARRARLTVTREGAVVVTLPARAAERTAAMLVAQHLDWLHLQLRRVAATRQRLAVRPGLTDGRRLEVNGIPHVVRVAAPGEGGGVRPRVERHLGSDEEGLTGELVVHPGRGDAAPAALLERWLRAEARRVIEARVAARAPGMAVAPGAVSIRAQRTRWGSASADGSLSFNWRLLLAPPFVLDAVVVHELAHLRVRGHSARFWTLVRSHAPRTDEARAWLRAHHAELLEALD
ncbi:MAG: SprT family zinc-dependent metalloprotease [Chloroflexota bacterium]